MFVLKVISLSSTSNRYKIYINNELRIRFDMLGLQYARVMLLFIKYITVVLALASFQRPKTGYMHDICLIED